MSVGRLPPIFPPVLPPSPYHSPLLPPLPSNNEIICSSLTVQKLILTGHAIHLKFKPTIKTEEKVRGCWDLHLLKAKRASGTLTSVSTLKIKFYYRCHHNRFATVFQLLIFININCGPILWAYINAGTSTLLLSSSLYFTPFVSPHSLSKLQLSVPPLLPSLSFSLSSPSIPLLGRNQVT